MCARVQLSPRPAAAPASRYQSSPTQTHYMLRMVHPEAQRGAGGDGTAPPLSKETLYSNYAAKLRRRFQSNPDIYRDSEDLYGRLEIALNDYELKDRLGLGVGFEGGF